MTTLSDPGAPTLSSTPPITLIVPVHNVEAHVAACIESIRAQTLSAFEVIVVDDGSTDGSHARAVEAIGGDPRFTVIRQANAGLSAARNAGLDRARGEVIGFVDSDDRVAPDFLRVLHGAMMAHDADWAACAIRSCHPDGSFDDHSAIHDSPVPDGAETGRMMPLNDWREIVRHFPSAWNKLYRRRLIDGLRYDEGTWFEDHAFYYQAAMRSSAILSLPQPLYLQTRGRPGQITASDSDRVFEQLSVLDRLHKLISASGRPGAREGFERIASRLLFERSTALRDTERRAAFAAAGQRYLAERGLRYTPEWDDGISRLWGLEMEGTTALSIILHAEGAAPGALRASLSALADPSLPHAEILICGGSAEQEGQGDPRVTQAVQADDILVAQAALQRARGRFVTCLDAGDLFPAQALKARLETMLRLDAEFGYSDFHFGREAACYHDGLQTHGLAASCPPWAPRVLEAEEIIAIHPRPLGKIYDTAFLRRVAPSGDTHLDQWQRVLTAGAQATRAVRFEDGALHAANLRAAPIDLTQPPRLANAIAALDLPAAQHVPGWRRRLYARAIRQGLVDAPGRLAQLRLAWQARQALRASPPLHEDGSLDTDIGPRLAWLFTSTAPRGKGRAAPHARGAGRDEETH